MKNEENTHTHTRENKRTPKLFSFTDIYGRASTLYWNITQIKELFLFLFPHYPLSHKLDGWKMCIFLALIPLSSTHFPALPRNVPTKPSNWLLYALLRFASLWHACVKSLILIMLLVSNSYIPSTYFECFRSGGGYGESFYFKTRRHHCTAFIHKDNYLGKFQA